jgi:hypothetical protein
MTPWMKAHFKVKAGSAEEKALTDWQHEIQFALEKHDPSKLALRVTHGRVPVELRNLIYKLIVLAPWRDARPAGGRARKLNAVDEIGVVNLYVMLRALSARRQTHAMIVDQLLHQYGVSKSTIERALKSNGVTTSRPKPPKVLKPKTQR